MKYTMIGHSYRYAVDQTAQMLHLDGDIRSALYKGQTFTTAVCKYRGYRGTAKLKTKLLDDSTAQKIIKISIYRAYLASGEEKPAWGALTGVRPGKLMIKLMDEKKFIDMYDVSPERARLCYETSRCTQEAMKVLGAKDTCIYLGVPFCPTRCAYCSFVSASVEKTMKLITPFVDALLNEIERTEIEGKIKSIYFGGGTPTTLSAEQLDRVISKLEKHFDLSSVTEFTVEAGRPDTITKEKLQVLKNHGVTRVSVNPQTMSNRILEIIGRRHSAEDVLDALDLVRQCGNFDVNMDLIAGLPGDDSETFKKSMDMVVSLAPENITIHTLSLKNGSRITMNGTEIPAPDVVAKMLDYAYEQLRKKDYSPYYLYRQKNMSGGFENTGWTISGHENLYNIAMMEELCNIIAFGAGGSTKIISDGKISRKVNPKYPLEYIEKYV